MFMFDVQTLNIADLNILLSGTDALDALKTIEPAP